MLLYLQQPQKPQMQITLRDWRSVEAFIIRKNAKLVDEYWSEKKEVVQKILTDVLDPLKSKCKENRKGKTALHRKETDITKEKIIAN